jgi:uncharacterized repeat protein (TIGR03917 family)
MRDLAEGEDSGRHEVAPIDAPGADDVGAAVRQERAPGVVAAPWDGHDWALVVGSGSDLAELYDQIARLPAGLAFAEAFGDVDLVLVYRPEDQAPSRRKLLSTLVEQVVGHGGTLVGPVGPGGLSASERYQTAAERAAFAAGQQDALSAMRRALTGAFELPVDQLSAAS